jgi:hypothetical protein
VPNGVTGIEYAVDTEGPRKDRYTRTDCASVDTGRASQNTGDTYEVQKVHGRWKIISKSHWMMTR